MDPRATSFLLSQNLETLKNVFRKRRTEVQHLTDILKNKPDLIFESKLERMKLVLQRMEEFIHDKEIRKLDLEFTTVYTDIQKALVEPTIHISTTLQEYNKNTSLDSQIYLTETPIVVTKSFPDDNDTTCLLCFNKFSERETLIQHVKKHPHASSRYEQILSIYMEKTISAGIDCFYCNEKGFITKKLFFRHLKKDHVSTYNVFVNVLFMSRVMKNKRGFFMTIDNLDPDEIKDDPDSGEPRVESASPVSISFERLGDKNHSIPYLNKREKNSVDRFSTAANSNLSTTSREKTSNARQIPSKQSKARKNKRLCASPTPSPTSSYSLESMKAKLASSKPAFRKFSVTRFCNDAQQTPVVADSESETEDSGNSNLNTLSNFASSQPKTIKKTSNNIIHIKNGSKPKLPITLNHSRNSGNDESPSSSEDDLFSNQSLSSTSSSSQQKAQSVKRKYGNMSSSQPPKKLSISSNERDLTEISKTSQKVVSRNEDTSSSTPAFTPHVQQSGEVTVILPAMSKMSKRPLRKVVYGLLSSSAKKCPACKASFTTDVSLEDHQPRLIVEERDPITESSIIISSLLLKFRLE